MQWTRWTPCLLILMSGVTHADPNLILNGGFDSGNFSSWTESGNLTPCVFVGSSTDSRCIPTTGIGPHSGSYAAELGNYGADAFLSQTVATAIGGNYQLSFWLASQDYGTPSNDFSVSWGGQQLFSGVNLAPFGYTQFVFSGLTASSSSATLSFAFHNDPSYFVLDDISLTGPAVPESDAWTLWPLALAVLALCGRRRQPATERARL